MNKIKIKKEQFYNGFNKPNHKIKPHLTKNIIDKENYLTHQIYFCDVDIVCPLNKNNNNNNINNINNIKTDINIKNSKKSININDDTLLRNGEFTKLDMPIVIKEREQKDDMRLDYLPFELQNPNQLNLPFPRGGELTRTKYKRANEGGETEGRSNLQNKKPDEIIQINY